MRLRDGAAVIIGGAGPIGWPDGSTQAPSGAAYEASLCGGLRLQVLLDGCLELGDAATANTATARLSRGGLLEVSNGGLVQVNAGSQLIIESGATLVVRNGGSLVVDGRVQVEPGGFICVEPTANLMFTTTAELFVSGAATLGVPAGLNITPTNCSPSIAVCAQVLAPANGGHPNVTQNTAGNEALAFDGNDDQVVAQPNSSPVFALGTEFTVEAFIRSNRTAQTPWNNQTIVSTRQQGALRMEGMMLTLLTDNSLSIQLNETNFGAGQASTTLPFDNACHHVAVTRDANYQLRFYIDGVQATYSPSTARPAASPAPLYLGSDAAGSMGPENFDGHLGEVRLWNVARTAQQLRQARTEKLTPQTGLVAYYDMLDPTSSTQLTDLSNNGVTADLGAGNLAPQWVSRCNLTCTVQGNFRGTNPTAGTVAHRGGLPDTAATARASRQLAGIRQSAAEPVAGTTWSLAPNPARQAATLYYELAAGEQARVRILDLAGFERRRVPTEAARHGGTQQLVLPLAGLRPGTYLVEVAAGSRRVLRLVVNE